MKGRQRLGAVLVIVGAGLVGLGAMSLASGAGGTAAQPAPSGAPSTGPTADPSTAAPATTAVVSQGPTVAPTADTLAIVRAFFERLQGAIRAGTQGDLVDSLAPAVFDRYGRDACAANLSAKPPVPEEAFEIVAVRAPASWDYETDGRVTPVENVTTVDARVTGPDPSGVVSTETRELHVLVVGATVQWFTDCGDPLSAP